MKRLIVGLLEGLSLIIAGILLLVGFQIGREMGLSSGNQNVGAIGGVIVALIVDVLIFGALFVFLEMNESLRKIVTILESQKALLQKSQVTPTPQRPIIEDRSPVRPKPAPKKAAPPKAETPSRATEKSTEDSSPPTTATDAKPKPEARPDPKTAASNHPAPYPFWIKHKGKTIYHNNQTFVVEGNQFQSADEAKQFIDKTS